MAGVTVTRVAGNKNVIIIECFQKQTACVHLADTDLHAYNGAGEIWRDTE